MRARGRFLVAIDFSSRSAQVLTVARDLARRSGAEIVLAHVRPGSDVRAAVEQERGDLLRGVAGSLRSRIAAHYARRMRSLAHEGERQVILSGAPDLALTREARRGYDLVVVGRRGLGTASSLLLGSTAERVISRSPVPVLVVPSRRR